MRSLTRITQQLINHLRHNLLWRFSLVAFLVTGGLALAVVIVLSQQIEKDALADLEAEAVGSVVDRVLVALLPSDLQQPMSGERYREFHGFVERAIHSNRTARIKIWSSDATVIYSDDPAAIGGRFPDNQHFQAALTGQNSTEVKSPTDPENERERHLGTLMEVYTPIIFPGDTEPSGVLEIYQYYAPTANRIERLQAMTTGLIGGGSLVLYLSLVTIVAGGWRTIMDQRASLDAANKRLISANEDLRGAEDRLRQILDTAGEGIFGVGAHGIINFVNPVAAHILGWEAAELHGTHHTKVLHPQVDGPHSTCPVCITLLDGRIHHADDSELLRKDGGKFPAEFTSSPIVRNGSLKGAVVVFSDISDRKRAELELRESQRTLSTLMSNLPGMAYRCRNDRDWTMTFVSEGCLELTGYPPHALMESSQVAFADLIHSDDREGVWSEVQAALTAERPFQLTYRIKTAAGGEKWVWEQGRLVGDSRPGGEATLEGFITDITERVRLQQQLEHDAFHDGLTGLPNRALFMDRLRQALHRKRRNPQSEFAVLFLDIDRFKVINDSMGHLEGDQVLKMIGDRLTETVRGVDTVARLGGDEFALLLTDLEEPSGATRVAERVLKRVADPFPLAGKQVAISTSIGISLSSTGYDEAAEVLRDADLAMYRAKSEGKGNYALYDLAMHEQAMRQLDLESDLREALEQDQFELHYQPIVSLQEGLIHGFEGLIRWRHPIRGLVMPNIFLEVAEEAGLMPPLGEWVIRRACRQLAEWRDERADGQPYPISVNLSHSQFWDPELPQILQKAISETGVHASWLCLEVTENVAMQGRTKPEKTLERLRDMGFGLHIDDFGTGYSSLAVLHRFPVDVIKIDRSFVAGLTDQSVQTGFVETILLLASRLQVGVIAEGVESREQADTLIRLGCPLAQGYFYGRPALPENLSDPRQALA